MCSEGAGLLRPAAARFRKRLNRLIDPVGRVTTTSWAAGARTRPGDNRGGSNGLAACLQSSCDRVVHPFEHAERSLIGEPIGERKRLLVEASARPGRCFRPAVHARPPQHRGVGHDLTAARIDRAERTPLPSGIQHGCCRRVDKEVRDVRRHPHVAIVIDRSVFGSTSRASRATRVIPGSLGNLRCGVRRSWFTISVVAYSRCRALRRRR